MEDMIVWGLTILPNVTTVSVACEHAGGPSSDALLMCIPDKRYHHYSQDEEEVIQRYQDVEQCYWTVKYFTTWPLSASKAQFSLEDLSQAISRSNARITKFRTLPLEKVIAQGKRPTRRSESLLPDRIPIDGFIRPPLLLPEWSPMSLGAFKNIKSLSLGFKRRFNRRQGSAQILPELLSQAEALEDLTFGFNEVWSNDLENNDLEAWFGPAVQEKHPKKWHPQRLKRLALFNISTTRACMKQPLSSMEGEVQEVTLKRIYPCDPEGDFDWNDVLETLRSLRLRKVYLGYVFGFRRVTADPGTLLQGMLDYALHKSDENPLDGMRLLR